MGNLKGLASIVSELRAGRINLADQWSLSGTPSGTARPCDFGSSGPLSGRLFEIPFLGRSGVEPFRR
jgi:hypothetical protein